jgi:deazaflavin-dependent oxidoreductase (nitroreductase family)
LKAIGRIHTFLYRRSGGRIGGRAWGLRILLLTTTGRKTGRLWTTPLCCYPDGDALVVVASNGGGRTPSWFLNLKQNPAVTIQLGREQRAVTAREATPEERARLWAAITTVAPGYLKYQERAHRTIPLGILEPAQR